MTGSFLETKIEEIQEMSSLYAKQIEIESKKKVKNKKIITQQHYEKYQTREISTL